MKLFPVALICLATLAGCAFGTRKVNLLYGDRVTPRWPIPEVMLGLPSHGFATAVPRVKAANVLVG